MPYFSFRSFSCSSFFFVSIFWKAYNKRGNMVHHLGIQNESTWPERSSVAVSTYSVRVVVEDNKVAVADIEAREMVACVLCIKNVFIHHVGSSSGLRSVSSEVAKGNTTQLATIHQWHATLGHCLRQLRESECVLINAYVLIWRIGPYFPKMSYISSAVIL